MFRSTKVFQPIFNLFLILLLMSSFKKETLKDQENEEESKIEALVNKWFKDGIAKTKGEYQSKIIALNKNLDINGMSLGKVEKEQLVVIPIKPEVSKSQEVTIIPTFLFLMVNSNHIGTAGIFSYEAVIKKTTNKPMQFLEKFLNNIKVEEDGFYKFYTLSDKLKWEMFFKNGRLVYDRTLKTEPQKTENATVLTSGCKNWYMVTNSHPSAEKLVTTKEFVYKICNQFENMELELGAVFN
jgi:hypothetical protein